MARPLRIQAPGLTYHVTARGVRRTSIYVDNIDRRRFLTLLADVVQRHGLRCHAYCEMTNHYHLAVTTTSANLSRAVQQLNATYAQWWNWRHQRAGHLFQGRFHAQVVQDERYLANVCRYIVLNPVRAAIVDSPEAWPWSSYRATVGLTRPPLFLTCEQLLDVLGAGDPDAGRDRFQREVRDADVAQRLPREAVLGDEAFVSRLQPLRAGAGREVPRRQARLALETIFSGAITRKARDAAVVAAVGERYAMAEVARYLDVHPSTISKILMGSEREKSVDSRSDPSDPSDPTHDTRFSSVPAASLVDGAAT